MRDKTCCVILRPFARTCSLIGSWRSKRAQQLPTMLGVVSQQCCVRLHGAKSLTGFKLCATTSNNMQQDVQTDATCNIQQCWELLVNNVASVCTQPNNSQQHASTHMLRVTSNNVGSCWPTLRPFVRGFIALFRKFNYRARPGETGERARK